MATAGQPHQPAERAELTSAKQWEPQAPVSLSPSCGFRFLFFGLACMFICSKYDFVISILKPGHFPNHPNFSLVLKGLELGLYGACSPPGRLIGKQHGGRGRGGAGWQRCCRLCQGPGPQPGHSPAAGPVCRRPARGRHGPGMRRHPWGPGW